MKKHFQYDGLIIIDGDLKNFQQKKEIINRDNSKNFLSITFNSRNFSISEINKINKLASYSFHDRIWNFDPEFNCEESNDVAKKIYEMT